VTDSNATPQPGDESLQFDRVEGAAGAAEMKCASCGNPIVASYYDVNGQHFCMSCKTRAERSNEPVRGFGPFAKAFVFGFAACLLGAGIYYGIAAAFNLEIGLIAILIGYMVGVSIRKATGGSGGRRFQILALTLTYFSIGLSYTPFAVKELSKSARSDSASVASAPIDSITAAPDSGAVPAAKKEPLSAGGLAAALAIVFGGGILMVFALPLLVVFGDMPGGLISAAIIGFGMQQAWKMTAHESVTITGPYRVGDVSPAAPPTA